MPRTTGHQLTQFIDPAVAPAPAPPAEPQESTVRADKPFPLRGHAHKKRGYHATTLPLAVFRMGTSQAGALWPFMGTRRLPPIGMPIGYEVSGGSTFYAGPTEWVLDKRVAVTNNNVVVVGKPGNGKTATVKAYLTRRIACGAQIMIWGDPKDEYADMVRFFGSEPIVLGPGLPARLNPLDKSFYGEKVTAENYSVVQAHWVRLLEVIIATQSDGGRPVHVGPTERTVLAEALSQASGAADHAAEVKDIIIPDVLDALKHPTQHAVSETGFASQREYLDATRVLRHSVQAFIAGPLSGMFDGHTNIRFSTEAPIQSLSLGALRATSTENVAVAMQCLTAFAAAYRRTSGSLRVNVHDEGWYTSRLGAQFVKDKDAAMRLSRADNSENWQIMHQFADLLGAGSDEQTREIAKTTVGKADTIIMHGLDAKPAQEAADLLDLDDTVRDAVSGWAMQAPGRALWRVGGQSFRVQTYRTPTDVLLSDSNSRLKTGADAL